MRVLIVPRGPTSEAVLDSLTTWSGSALLEPFCWWVAPSAASEATAQVTRVERGESHEDLLAVALEGADQADIALVAFAPVGAGESVPAAFVDAADACVEMARNVLAFGVGSSDECLMVVAPAEVGQPVPPELFVARWAANVYVAPEDRFDPADFNHLVANAAAFPRHAAHAVASIADLWVRAEPHSTGVLATLSMRHLDLAPPPVQVVRCFSRVVDYGFVIDHLAAGVFSAGGAWPNPDPRRFDRIADPGSVLPDLARAFLDKHADVLGLSRCDPMTLDPPVRLGLLAALRELIKLIIRRLRNKPFEILESQIARVHDMLAERIEHYSGDNVLVVRYFDRAAGDRSLLELREFLHDQLRVPDGPVAAAWADLWQLTLGIVDGAGLPPETGDDILARGNLRALVTDPGRIGPHPGNPPPATEEDPDPRVCDPLRWLEEQAAIEQEAAVEDDPTEASEGQELRRRRRVLLTRR